MILQGGVLLVALENCEVDFNMKDKPATKLKAGEPIWLEGRLEGNLTNLSGKASNFLELIIEGD